MATMASMLARAARSASVASRASRADTVALARVARSASVASRAAAAAVSRAARSSTGAAAADLVSSRDARSFRSYSSTNPPCSPSLHSGSSVSPDDKPVVDKAKFVAEEKDLESDEAIWALYERWCKHFKEERDRDEMVRRFDQFKKKALLVHKTNNSDLPYTLEINRFADGQLLEMCCAGNLAFRRTLPQYLREDHIYP